MKRLRILTAGLVLAGILGCGQNDPNKDLKPVNPAAKPFKMVDDSQGGAAKKGERGPTMVK
jgi:hypothetical protein